MGSATPSNLQCLICGEGVLGDIAYDEQDRLDTQTVEVEGGTS